MTWKPYEFGSDPESVPGGAWGPDDTIVYHSLRGGLIEISASGGTPHAIGTSTKHSLWRWPQFMPDGGTILLTGGASYFSFGGTASITAVPRRGVESDKDLIAGGTMPRLAATGDLDYAQNGALMAVPFNSRRLELAGSPVPALDGVRQSMFGAAQYGFSAGGTLVFIQGKMQSYLARMVWVDRAGKEQPIAAPARPYSVPKISPDGRRIPVSITETMTNIWLYDMARDALSRVTLGGTTNANPLWSPDGNRLVFNSDRAGTTRSLFLQPADGSGTAEQLNMSQWASSASSWSPDGQTIAFTEAEPDTGYDIWMVGLGDRKPRPFLRTRYNETAPKFSPDGHWLAYASDESGRWEVYVQPYPGPGGKWQISTEGGSEPVWNPTGHELFYRLGNRMMAVSATLQPGFSMGRPVVLFEGPWLSTPLTVPNYDISRDGRRFLMLKAADEDQGPRQIAVVQNWFEELKRRMAARKN